MKRFLLLFLMFMVSQAASASDREWKQGKLLSYDQHTFTTYSQQNGTGRDYAHTTYSVQIDTDERVYFVERTLNWRWQKFPKVTENGPISWALKGKNEMVLRDDEGKEFTVTVSKTRLKTPGD